jgi:CheY-like chemotaxis protein
MLTEYLAFRGFQVAEARHGAEAIEATRRVHPNIILMDLTMPAMDGWEATRQLKADPLTRAIIIIAVSAHAFASERASARDAGCDGFIAKPFDLAVLADVLERVLVEGRAGLDAKAATLNGAPRRRSIETSRLVTKSMPRLSRLSPDVERVRSTQSVLT